MNVSHRVTQFNCGQPLRDHTPSEPIHPYLHEVNIDASLIRGMIKSTSGDNKDGAIKEGEEFLPLTQSTQLIESLDKSAPTPAAISGVWACPYCESENCDDPGLLDFKCSFCWVVSHWTEIDWAYTPAAVTASAGGAK